MKLTLNILGKRRDDEERRWPTHMVGGRFRTSTLALIVAFLLVWWLYDTYRPHEPANSGPPPAQVVPPGFVPDPNYTWVPRSQVQSPPPRTTFTPTPATTTAPSSTVQPTTPTSPPPFVLPTLPCLPPFCTPSTTPAPEQPLPGPAPAPPGG